MNIFLLSSGLGCLVSGLSIALIWGSPHFIPNSADKLGGKLFLAGFTILIITAIHWLFTVLL